MLEKQKFSNEENRFCEKRVTRRYFSVKNVCFDLVLVISPEKEKNQRVFQRFAFRFVLLHDIDFHRTIDFRDAKRRYSTNLLRRAIGSLDSMMNTKDH